MIKIKAFATGLGIGTVLGTIASFMTDQKTGQPIKKEVKHFVSATSSDAKDIATSVQRAQSDVSLIKDKDIPQAKRGIKSLQRSVKEFQYSIQPNLEAIKNTVNKMSSEAENLK